MNRSESIKSLAVAHNKAQAEMSGAVKDSNNPFFKSKYADLSSVVKAVKEPFANNGLSYVQFPIEKDGRIGVETILMHSSGEWLSNEFTVQLSKQDAQGAGSAITYCRRYALQAIAGIPSEDDDGNAASPANNAQDDNKPWYNAFDDEKEFMRQRLQQGETNQGLIDFLSQSFKINKEVRQKIMELK